MGKRKTGAVVVVAVVVKEEKTLALFVPGLARGERARDQMVYLLC